MSKPTMLDLALEEWGILRDRLLDTYCAVICDGDRDYKRYYMPEFIYLVRSETNSDLLSSSPAHPDSLDSVLRESNCLLELIQDVQDKNSEFIKKYRNTPKDCFDPAVLRQIRRKIPLGTDF